MNVAIIGGGAAGFFAAIQVKENYPQATVSILEKSNKLLAKVKVSGGGRCNVTNGCERTSDLVKGYPRGANKLKKAFREFDNHKMQQWLRNRGVELKIEEDGRVFPASNDSQTIINCFMKEAERLNINIVNRCEVNRISSQGDRIVLSSNTHGDIVYDKIIIATGGSPKRSGLDWLEALGHSIEEPVPSLFTFNMPNEAITKLMGTVVENAIVSVQGTKLKSEGPLLITHWGMSGPAVLKLSAFGARDLANKNYQFYIQVNWINEVNNEVATQLLQNEFAKHPNKQISNIRLAGLPERLWLYLLHRIELSQDKKVSELGKKGINRLVNILTNDVYIVNGKTTFKEEFVTCGGVSLSSVNFGTMQSLAVPGLYFSGEVLDIDGITGGYNFQAAWTTAFIAGQLRS